MIRTAVSSSSIRAIGFDESESRMEIEFTDGMVYEYFSVSAATFSELVSARSVGAKFNELIKGCFDCRRIA